MTLPDRHNQYSFKGFTEKVRSVDFYSDDSFFQRIVNHYCSDELPALHDKLLKLSFKVSFRWSELADRIARPELRPYMEHYDAFNQRVDRIVRPLETSLLEQEAFSEALFSSRTGKWENFTKRFLLHQIGESCVMCPTACTEGLIALIQEFPEGRHPELSKILLHCTEGIDGDFGIGAQFMTEIQGGSDIPANLLEVEPVGDHYRVYGAKFFCSAMHADYSVITAKVTGSEDVGTFIVPSWLPGEKKHERRNGYRINRFKWKLGTAELPTAEIEYDGAVAYAVGPTNRGVANAVGIVLTLSRIAVATSSAAAMTRAAREALIYSQFRDVFGKKICEWPLAAGQLRDLQDAAQRTTAGAFKVYDLFIRLGKTLQPGLESKDPLDIRKLKFNLRELIILQKLVSAYETVDVIRKAMSIFGGHGVIEDFSSLPRLFRDATVNELWEGPRNVLLMQVFRDIQRVSSWYPPEEFTSNILQGAPKETVESLSATLKDLLAEPPFFELSPGAMERAALWETFCDDLFRAYQEQALNEVGRAPLLKQ
ncbi:MAG: acyl-CoA dehydrogenase family protein [Desulfomonile tiedjei]|uniref:Acyl-CoA dehydrogenase family protein n=1 Tax=Desulfomonile tiedjei TaxID=2358 RepID=A0A9D6UZR9_9BACT|nr:acyl-CoA dehydrogenase family protein [Desulfomonile tiedjei]